MKHMGFRKVYVSRIAAFKQSGESIPDGVHITIVALGKFFIKSISQTSDLR